MKMSEITRIFYLIFNNHFVFVTYIASEIVFGIMDSSLKLSFQNFSITKVIRLQRIIASLISGASFKVKRH